MVRFMSMTSGSCGNCYYLGVEEKGLQGESAGGAGLLIDAGASLRRVKKCLLDNKLDFDSINAVLITHDHLDHIRHLGSYCKRIEKPVYTTDILHKALSEHTFTRDYINNCCRELTDDWNEIPVCGTSAMVKYFIVPHDATQTVGYAINIAGHRFVLMTDMGHMTDEALSYAKDADTVVIESNYDIGMLMGGSYTYELKMRICKGNGHLSNDACADAIKRFYHKGLKNLFLCHLSGNNNTPEVALASARQALEDIGVQKGTLNLRVLPRGIQTPLFYL